MDYRKEREKLWSRFNGGKQGTLWYYHALVNAFGANKRIKPLIAEIDRVLTELESLANKGASVTEPPPLNSAKSRTM